MFTVQLHHIIIAITGLLLGLIISRLLSKKPPSENKGLFANIFTSNKELDTTLGILVFAYIITLMILHFHDDIASEAGYIILAAVNGITALLAVKKHNGNQH